MGVLNAQAWMPEGMNPADKDSIAAASPGDPHRAAAVAWEAWAATLQTGGSMGAQSVSTGAQSVSYGDGYGSGPAGEALRRAAWHRARAKVRSVESGPLFAAGWPVADEDTGVIATYDAGTVP